MTNLTAIQKKIDAIDAKLARHDAATSKLIIKYNTLAAEYNAELKLQDAK
tara:strand:- start:860 stop:1009 length:150 start_codon:yes stop_codon:yes gene_type:complete